MRSTDAPEKKPEVPCPPAGLPFRDGLNDFFQLVWRFSDNLWKVWRWFGLGLLALAAWARTGENAAMAFGVLATTIGIAALAAWVAGPLLLSLRPGAWDRGRVPAVAAACFVIFLTLAFAVTIWVYTAVLSYPVFRTNG